jgi:hypothetical protein
MNGLAISLTTSTIFLLFVLWLVARQERRAMREMRERRRAEIRAGIRRAHGQT